MVLKTPRRFMTGYVEVDEYSDSDTNTERWCGYCNRCNAEATFDTQAETEAWKEIHMDEPCWYND